MKTSYSSKTSLDEQLHVWVGVRERENERKKGGKGR